MGMLGNVIELVVFAWKKKTYPWVKLIVWLFGSYGSTIAWQNKSKMHYALSVPLRKVHAFLMIVAMKILVARNVIDSIKAIESKLI